MKVLLRSINYSCLKPILLNRAVLLVMTAALALGGLLSWHYGYINLSVRFLLLFCSLFIGALLATWTEELTAMPAERVMNFIRGFGIKGEDAEFDEKGVPVISIRELGEFHYNPVRVAMAGFQYYDQWKQTGGQTALAKLINCADSLVEHLSVNQFEGGEFGVWEYHYPLSNLVPPWVSGLAQGVGVQLLARAYMRCGEDRYLQTAHMAFRAFDVEVKDGGVTYKDSPDEWWYEEYAGRGCIESRVLNGMVYALVGIDEYRRVSNDSMAESMFDRGVKSLLKRLDDYDAGWWTHYDAMGMLAARSYHQVHINQMKQMYDITGDVAFKERWLRWRNYRSPFFIREFVKQRPGWHDLMTLLVNIFAVYVLLEMVYIIAILLRKL